MAQKELTEETSVFCQAWPVSMFTLRLLKTSQRSSSLGRDCLILGVSVRLEPSPVHHSVYVCRDSKNNMEFHVSVFT